MVCSRCKISVTPELEIPPLRICLVCYSMIPENEGLTRAELLAKARGSRYARARIARTRRAQKYEVFMGDPQKADVPADQCPYGDPSHVRFEECDTCQERKGLSPIQLEREATARAAQEGADAAAAIFTILRRGKREA